jgi:hypothetical protein
MERSLESPFYKGTFLSEVCTKGSGGYVWLYVFKHVILFNGWPTVGYLMWTGMHLCFTLHIILPRWDLTIILFCYFLAFVHDDVQSQTAKWGFVLLYFICFAKFLLYLVSLLCRISVLLGPAMGK